MTDMLQLVTTDPTFTLYERARFRVADVVWLARDAAAAGLLTAAEKMAPGFTSTSHIVGFRKGCAGRMLAIADTPGDLHMLLDHQHGARPVNQ